MNRENYARDPGRRFARALLLTGWEELSPGLWHKGSYRILVDSIGIFLYQTQGGQWRRTYGLSHNLILTKHLRESCLYFPDFTLNLG